MFAESIKPIKPVKASEFLRQAVDNYLAANMGDFLEGKNRGICLCLSLEANEMPEKEAVFERIQHEVRQYIPEGRGYLFDWNDELSVEQRQAIRFMFSEFLALYFEDMGD